MTEVYNKLNSGSPKKDVHTQIPRTCECDFIWKKSLCWCNKVKDLEINSFWITQVGPKSKDKCPFRRKKRRATDRRRRQPRHSQGRDQNRVARSQGNAWSHQKLDKAKKRIFLRALWGSTALTLPWFQTSSCLEVDRWISSIWKLPACGHLLW